MGAYYQEASVETNKVEGVCGGSNKPFSFNKILNDFFMIKFDKEKYKTYKAKSNDGWLKERAKFISATQTLFALCNFADEDTKSWVQQFDVYHETPYQFYCQKTMTGEQVEIWSEYLKIAKPSLYAAQQYGIANEKLVAQNGFEKLQETDESFKNAELKYNGRTIHYIQGEVVCCTPDYFIIKENGDKVLLECKTMSVKEQQDEIDKQNELIEKYKIQVLTQMLCTGIEEAYLAVMYHKGDNILNTEVIKIDFADYTINELMEQILSSSKKCVDWLNDKTEGIGNAPNLDIEADRILYDLATKTLQQRADEYFNQKKIFDEFNELHKNLEEKKNLVKAQFLWCVSNEVNIDGVTIQSRKQATQYWDMEKIEKEEQKLQKIKELIKNGEQVIQRNGFITITNIIRNGLNFSDI